ncbi:uncharacterized protein [Rutidosis leptorrhynchoides]|uniref:uncharacterized protein n=1 Tax=Rutidosis leptorrhynchoides TaxID=125765 RepID=UPI003A98EB1C
MSKLIDSITLVRENSAVETLRNRLVPKKVEIFIWRARRGRIPVRLELDKRGIDLHSVRCPVCDGGIESVEHILFSCQFAQDVWLKVLNWWGYNTSIFGFDDIFNGTFGSLATDNKKFLWQAVCWIVCYLLWKNRNEKVFKNKIRAVPSLNLEIQTLSFDWLSRRQNWHKLEWHNWIKNRENCRKAKEAADKDSRKPPA